MIKVLCNDKIIKVSGHAKFGDYGNDIVCASVSSIIYTTINGILNIDKDAINYEDNNELIIHINSDDEIIQKLINNMLVLLKDLERQYPKNIKVKESKDVIY